MEKVSSYLQKQTEAVTFSTVKTDVVGEDKFIAVALERLIQEGYATETAGARNSRLVCHKVAYTGQDPPLRPSIHAESDESQAENDENGPISPLRTPASPLREGVTLTPARASLGAGVERVETPNDPGAGVDVYDPTIQHLLDDLPDY
jgi:hypothetical protein